MTYLDAAYHILHQAGQPLRYEKRRARPGPASILPQSITPEARQ
ncbi:MAG TPA: hypothetical protein VL334_25715 [Anaerolineae bacterium]|nr:hypothetical protein [Anaerolineae bacterium]